MENIKARSCHPEDCQDLREYLLSATEEIRKPSCRFCGSADLVKQGVVLLHGKVAQKYSCKICKRHSYPNTGFSFRKKHSNQVIQYAQSLGNETDPAFSARDIAKKVKQKFGLKVSHVTIVRWLKWEPLMEMTTQDEAA